MKYPPFIHYIILSVTVSAGAVYYSELQEKIVLDPDTMDEFILDPADFEPDNENASILRHEPFGRKKEAVYTKGTKEDGSSIIEAVSDGAISTVTTSIEADPAIFKNLEWEWKIDQVMENGDLTQKDGDDFPARIYVTFDYSPSDLRFGEKIKYRLYKTFTSFEIPLRSLNYIWANKASVGTVAESPFTNWVQYVVIQSGNENAGTWQLERRNIIDDYREAFGEEPKNITGITIMTDSDNTGETTRAYFGKIKLAKN